MAVVALSGVTNVGAVYAAACVVCAAPTDEENVDATTGVVLVEPDQCPKCSCYGQHENGEYNGTWYFDHYRCVECCAYWTAAYKLQSVDVNDE